MSTETISLEIIRMKEGVASHVTDVVVEETPLTILCNKVEVATLLCTPGYEKELGVGFLAAGGVIKEASEIESLTYIKEEQALYVTCSIKEGDRHLFFKKCITTGCGRGTIFLDEEEGHIIPYSGNLIVQAKKVLTLMQEMQSKSQLYLETGGVHSAALCDEDSIRIFREDVGRHNAVDKIIGHVILENISLEDKCLLTSGRISSEIILKVAQAGIGGVISRSAPTARAVDLATKLNITLLGFVRGKRMNIYAGAEKVKK